VIIRKGLVDSVIDSSWDILTVLGIYIRLPGRNRRGEDG
jgi:hypothetical protein